jgi:hypothetical protein
LVAGLERWIVVEGKGKEAILSRQKKKEMMKIIV